MNGYKGLFYHFLDINSGVRVWSCELSTIDTALLMAGVLDARQYFDGADPARSRTARPGRFALPAGRLGMDARSGANCIRHGLETGIGFLRLRTGGATTKP